MTTTPLTALVSGPLDAPWIETLPGEIISVRVRTEDVAGRYSIVESVAQPGTASPLHFHAEDEIFRVLEGTMTFSLDGKIVELGPDNVIAIPAKVPHSWKNRSNQPVRLAATFVPGGVERFLEQLGQTHPDQLAALAESFGTIIVGPPLD